MIGALVLEAVPLVLELFVVGMVVEIIFVVFAVVALLEDCPLWVGSAWSDPGFSGGVPPELELLGFEALEVEPLELVPELEVSS